MTDANADDSIEKSIALELDRNSLLNQTYEQVKCKLGAKEAARFLQAERQLLLIIDLQIGSHLPAVKWRVRCFCFSGHDAGNQAERPNVFRANLTGLNLEQAQ
jgi:hypothetical protein